MLCVCVCALTSLQLVSNDDEESYAGPKSVDGDGDFTQDPGDFATSGSNDLLVGAFITDLMTTSITRLIFLCRQYSEIQSV